MGKGPGIFSEIGKKARDTLYKDYYYDHKFSLTANTSTGLVFTSTGIKQDETVLGDVTVQFKKDILTADLKVDTKSSISATVTVDEPTPGLKAILNFTVPDQKASKVEVQYKHGYASVSTSVGLTPSPIMEFSTVFGANEIGLGGEVGFDSVTSALTKYNAGLSYSKPDFTAALFLLDRGDTVKFSYAHTLSPLTNSVVAAEISHSISKNNNAFTVGGSYMLDPLTTVKGRISHIGKVSASLQHEWIRKSFVTISGEFDALALDKKAKVGVSVIMKP